MVKEGRKVQPVPDGDVDAVLPHLSPPLRAAVELQRWSGMRSGEVLAIRTCDVDTSGDVWLYSPARHKADHHGRSRRIFLGERAQAVLRPWLRADASANVFQPKEAMEAYQAERRRNRRTPMTPSQRARTRQARPRRTAGEHYDTLTYNHVIARACARAGVARWHPHQLRHGVATRLCRAFGLDAARVVLGHGSPRVTESYAEADLAKAQAVMRQVG
jgi:integrase